MIVRTFDGLQALTTPQSSWSNSASSSVNLYGYRQTYFDIWRTQPNVRICVDFLARNIAHVPPQAYRRVSDTDRIRLADHDLTTWLGKPNPGTCRYRLIDDLMTDLGIYFQAYWAKVRYRVDGRDAIGLLRLPPEEMTVEGTLYPTGFVWTVNGRPKHFAPSEIVHFAGYRQGISPLETLRRILAEEAAAGDYRENFWRHGARMPGVVTRPKEVKAYTQDQANDWRAKWRAAYGGTAGEDTILLQEGMTFESTGASAKDSEYTAGGKLRREVVAAAYHIPLPFVGILDHATFSNIKEQHRNLYQDCLGPWFEWLRQEIHRQLLVECEDQDAVYLEFNIDAKLAGAPEDRASSIHASTGRSWRTVNEARALENLPRIDDPDLDTIAPQQGGPSDATAHPTERRAARPDPDDDTDDDEEEDDDDADALTVAPVIQAARARQQATLAKLAGVDRPAAFLAGVDRWTRELAADLTPLVGAAEAGRLALDANVSTLTALAAEDA